MVTEREALEYEFLSDHGLSGYNRITTYMNSNAVSPVHLDQILVGKYCAETSDNIGAVENKFSIQLEECTRNNIEVL